MNIFQCRNGSLPGGLECIFKIIRKDETGNRKVFGCSKHSGKHGFDHYNLYPEHNQATGDIIYQPSNPSDPYKLGEIVISWENLTSHQSGRNFDSRSFPADIHPLYTQSEHNYPTKHFLGPDDLGEVFGDENPALVHPGWTTEKFYGLSMVEYCQGGIYGRYDEKADMVMHPCMRSHTELPNWVNYTNRKEEKPKKDLYIGFSSDNDIVNFANSFFKDVRIASRMSQAMIKVKNGTFINLWTLMSNNFVDHNTKRDFMKRTSVDSLATIYRGRANLQQFWILYNSLDSVSWNNTVLDENGVEISEKCKIYKDFVKIYKENILNWIMNYPLLKEVINKPQSKFEPYDRYWFVILLLKKARKDNILNLKVDIPDWLKNIILEKNDPVIRLFGKAMKYSELPAEYKAEYHDSQLDYVGSNTWDAVDSRYPGMLNIKKELINEKNKIDILGWGQFLEILKLGRRWTMNEIKNAYEHFRVSWFQEDPSIFYDWLDKVVNLPIEDENSLSENEFGKLLEKIGGTENDPIKRKGMKEPEPIQALVYGSDHYNLGDGSLSPQRAFASNIIDASLNWKNWETWDDWNVVKMPLGNWFEATGKVRSIREPEHDTFWTMLAAKGGLVDDLRETKKMLPDYVYEEAMKASQENIATLDSIVEGGLDSDDLGELMAYDNSDGSMTHLDKGEGLWHGEE